MIAIDFGTGAALALHGADGAMSKKELELKRVKGGRTPAMEFPMILEALFARGHDVVVESPTMGSSGCEVADIERILDQTDQTLYTLSARAVKNYRLDYGLKNPKYDQPPRDVDPAQTHPEDAAILYRIAQEAPDRLRVWRRPEPATRIHSSVRPMDKRLYRGPDADAFIALLPPIAKLSEELAAVVAPGGKYARSLVMPFAMALSEPWWKEGPPEEHRKRFFKLLGAYDHGYPSFYRRMTVVWMQLVAKSRAGVTKMGEVPRETRKEAQRMAQRQQRELFQLAR